jgi:hypothetical protein
MWIYSGYHGHVMGYTSLRDSMGYIINNYRDLIDGGTPIVGCVPSTGDSAFASINCCRADFATSHPQ